MSVGSLRVILNATGQSNPFVSSQDCAEGRSSARISHPRIWTEYKDPTIHMAIDRTEKQKNLVNFAKPEKNLCLGSLVDLGVLVSWVIEHFHVECVSVQPEYGGREYKSGSGRESRGYWPHFRYSCLSKAQADLWCVAVEG